MLETVGIEAAHLSQAWPLNDTGRSALLGWRFSVVSQFNTMSHYS